MARSFGKVLASIWGDPEFVGLTSGAQRVYMMLISQSRLTLAGSLDLMPERWAPLAADTTMTDVLEGLDELRDARFVAVDWATREVVIRTLPRHDLDKSRLNVNLVKGLWTSWAGILSPTLRKVVVDNLPDVVWDKSAGIRPDDAEQMRRSPRLQLPVPTDRPDEPSQPPDQTGSPDHRSDLPVATNGRDDPSEPPSPSPSPSLVTCHLSPVAAAADVSRAECPPDPNANQQQPRSPDQPTDPTTDTRKLIADAARILARRRAQRRRDVGEGWIHQTAKGIHEDRRDDAHAALERHDGPLTADQLADILEPPTGPPASNGNDPLAGQRQALLDRAAAGTANARALANETPDPNRVARVGDLRAAIRQPPPEPTP